VKHDARETEDNAGRPPDHDFLGNYRRDGQLNVLAVVPSRRRSLDKTLK
jgi:hypothetical protein